MNGTNEHSSLLEESCEPAEGSAFTTGPPPRHIRLHGQVGENIEYSVLVAGTDPFQRYFFSIAQEGDCLRIFSPGNEFLIGHEGISYQGNGGCFCEYMFGVLQPRSDLVKTEIVNRLVMYGLKQDESGSVSFSDFTSGRESYRSIFFEGHAVSNYFFFVNSSLLPRQLPSQQAELVRRLGKIIKRSATVGGGDDDALIAKLFPRLADNSAHLFVIKLTNRPHREYHDMFRSLYFRNRKIPDSDFARLVALAEKYGIETSQQERMRIDVMYRHPDNRRIVDEYRNILLDCSTRDEIGSIDNARLTRLKTLSLRIKIPGALFRTLDDMLQLGSNPISRKENDYLASTREVLEGIFLREKNIESHIDRDDLLRLIGTKKIAVENRDRSFDQLLLNAGTVCDEKIRDGADRSLLEDFTVLTRFLDRFDSVANLINQLAFMENVKIDRQMLHDLLEHKAAFDSLNPDCFREFFVNDLLRNVYLGRFGRRKVIALVEGLSGIEQRSSTIEDLHRELHAIDRDERNFLAMIELVRDRIHNFYSRFSSSSDLEPLRREVFEELQTSRGLLPEEMDQLFDDVIITIKKETMYLHSLLPEIITGNDSSLREDFLENSGLDRFSVEELERCYFEKNGLDPEGLHRIRKGLN